MVRPDRELLGDRGKYIRSDVLEARFLQQDGLAAKRAHEAIFKSHVRIEFLAASTFQHRNTVLASEHIHAEVVPNLSTVRLIVTSPGVQAVAAELLSEGLEDRFEHGGDGR